MLYVTAELLFYIFHNFAVSEYCSKALLLYIIIRFHATVGLLSEVWKAVKLIPILVW
jgi:hypothetical protein